MRLEIDFNTNKDFDRVVVFLKGIFTGASVDGDFKIENAVLSDNFNTYVFAQNGEFKFNIEETTKMMQEAVHSPDFEKKIGESFKKQYG